MTWYTCPVCGMKIEFFEGFNIECKGRAGNPMHAFTPQRSSNG